MKAENGGNICSVIRKYAVVSGQGEEISVIRAAQLFLKLARMKIGEAI